MLRKTVFQENFSTEKISVLKKKQKKNTTNVRVIYDVLRIREGASLNKYLYRVL